MWAKSIVLVLYILVAPSHGSRAVHNQLKWLHKHTKDSQKPLYGKRLVDKMQASDDAENERRQALRDHDPNLGGGTTAYDSMINTLVDSKANGLNDDSIKEWLKEQAEKEQRAIWGVGNGKKTLGLSLKQGLKNADRTLNKDQKAHIAKMNEKIDGMDHNQLKDAFEEGLLVNANEHNEAQKKGISFTSFEIAEEAKAAKQEENDLEAKLMQKMLASGDLDELLGGKIDKWKKEQQMANKARMAAAAAKTFERAEELHNKFNEKRDVFRDATANNIAKLNENFGTFMSALKEGFQPLEIDLDPGKGTDLDGNLIEPSAFEISLSEEQGEQDVWAQVGDESPDSPVVPGGDILDLLIKECYQGMAEGNRNQEVIDKNCLTADILTYRCDKPIDASFYIGVTFDITLGYNSEGFRGKLVKHWCREMNTYKGIFDVPDGMHIQGVYETKVNTETFSSVNEYIQTTSDFANTQSGNSSFAATKRALDSSGSESGSLSGSVSGGFGGLSAGFSKSTTDAKARTEAEAKLTSTKNQRKKAEQSTEITRNTEKTQKMVGELSINIIRYEMFLREVKPNYIHEDFLNCFMMLPQSFYAPKGPEKFQDFITRYGTHYVKAAKFGGKLRVIKTKTITDTAEIADFRSDLQSEVRSMVGNALVKQRAERAVHTEQFSLGVSASTTQTQKQTRTSGGISNTDSSSSAAEDSRSSNAASGSSTIDFGQQGSRDITTNKTKSVNDATILEVSGGSHMIATVITDLYSANFRSNLIQWIQSIPFFPKPFDFVFEPITKLLKHMVDDMIDADLYKTCLVDKEPFHVLKRQQSIQCQTNFARNHKDCELVCANSSYANPKTCDVISPRLLDCGEVLQKKEKVNRKVVALKTAIQLYIEEGSLHPKSFFTIPPTNPGCTIGYRTTNLNDDFDADLGESDEIDWDTVGRYHMLLQFDMAQIYFAAKNANEGQTPDESQLIGSNQQFVMFFDERDRRWYTKEKLGDPCLPAFSSEAVPYNELASAENEQSTTTLVPKPFIVGDERFVQIRLSMGLYVELNLNTGNLHINKRAVDAMKDSTELDVQSFLEVFSDTLDELGPEGSPGELVGFVDSLKPTTDKTPFPCNIAWSNNQMFESTDDVQQCVKVTVETQQEYFFVMAASLTDPQSWIYVHQQQTSLCIHRLNQNGQDQINACAPRYEWMTSGQIENMAEQLYICIYKVDDLLSVSLLRPSYSRLDRESAIHVLTYNTNQQIGENIFPRYYALAAGESPVHVKNIFMTEIESLQCQYPFVSEAVGGTFRCVLQCHEECSDKGCNAPGDPTKCVACKNAKFLVRTPENPDARDPLCIPDCNKSNSTKIFLITDASLRDPGHDGQKLCSQCHHECKTKCSGLTAYDCEGDEECENYKIFEEGADGIRRSKCVEECPEGYWKRLHIENPNLNYTVCDPCPLGCKRCLIGDEYKNGDGSVEVEVARVRSKSCKPGEDPDTSPDCIDFVICIECLDNYLSSVYNITHNTCNLNSCPYKYQRRGNDCVKPWRTLAYQSYSRTATFPTATIDCTADCTSDLDETVWQPNYFRFGKPADFVKYKNIYEQLDGTAAAYPLPAATREANFGIYEFRLVWKVDETTVFVLEWKQTFSPLEPSITVDSTCTTPADCVKSKQYNIEVFNQISCNVEDERLKSLVRVELTSEYFFENCPHENIVVVKHEDDGTLMGFGSDEPCDEDGCYGGLEVLTGVLADSKGYFFSAAVDIAGVPLSDIYSIGWKHSIPDRGLPAFRLPSSGDTFYATEMIIAVSDQRTIPIGWTSWTAASSGGTCSMDCTTGLVTRARSRHCRCFLHTSATGTGSGTVIESDTDADFYDKCQPCGPEEEQTKTENCTLPTCDTTAADNAITSSSYMHHYCCEASTAIRIMGKNVWGDGLGITGVYELKYDETNDENHEYLLLDPNNNANNAKIKRVKVTDNPAVGDVYYYWVVYDNAGTEIIRSGKGNCPQNVAQWGQVAATSLDYTTDSVTYFKEWENDAAHLADTGGTATLDQVFRRRTKNYPEISVTCSSGRDKCPEDFPYSYNYGQKCCQSPFEATATCTDVSCVPTGKLLTPASTECYGLYDNVAGFRECSATISDRACRSNLDNVSVTEFRATENAKYQYEFLVCTERCGSVYMKSVYVP